MLAKISLPKIKVGTELKNTVLVPNSNCNVTAFNNYGNI
jgi:hypothetical protein